MKILHIFDDYGEPGRVALPGNGSVSEVVYNVAKHTADKGHEVTIIERDFGELPKEEEIDGIKYVRFSADKLPKAPYELIKSPLGMVKLVKDGFDVAGKINKFLKENDFDAIHVHFPFASNILLTKNRDLREKVIYTAHTNEYRLGLSKSLNPPLAVRFFSPDLYLIRRAKKSVVLNRSLEQALIRKGIKHERLEVVPNGINTKDFIFNNKELTKEKYGLSGIIVMFAGRLTPIKGLECLVKAAKILKNEEITFLIVGSTTLDKEYAQRLIEYTSREGIRVTFTGFVSHEELKALYSACDIFVLPSFEEGDPIALKEALASGRPLIGSNVGGIPMQVKDGWNGFLVEPGDEKQLAEKIKYLIGTQRERMGKKSRKLSEEKFCWSKIARKYLKVYKEFLNES